MESWVSGAPLERPPVASWLRKYWLGRVDFCFFSFPPKYFKVGSPQSLFCWTKEQFPTCSEELGGDTIDSQGRLGSFPITCTYEAPCLPPSSSTRPHIKGESHLMVQPCYCDGRQIDAEVARKQTNTGRSFQPTRAGLSDRGWDGASRVSLRLGKQ